MVWPKAVVLFLALFSSAPIMALEKVQFSGNLVTEPCVIPVGEESITLDFGTVIAKSLYTNQRSLSQPFSIHLAQCDQSIASTVSVTFHGAKSASLPGLLALDTDSSAAGISIGIEQENGELQPLDQASTAITLLSGDNLLKWRAFVQGNPKAIAKENITPGEFNATAIFKLSYQ